MKNRINAYEDRHKRSEAELSESTRPDLSVPPPPLFPHMPDEDATFDKPSTATSAAPPPTTALDGSTILRIPKVEVNCHNAEMMDMIFQKLYLKYN